MIESVSNTVSVANTERRIVTHLTTVGSFYTMKKIVKGYEIFNHTCDQSPSIVTGIDWFVHGGDDTTLMARVSPQFCDRDLLFYFSLLRSAVLRRERNGLILPASIISAEIPFRDTMSSIKLVTIPFNNPMAFHKEASEVAPFLKRADVSGLEYCIPH